jgi:hypothetical protein
MVRYLALLAGLAGLVLAARGVATTAPGGMAQRPVYALAAVRDGLARDAGAWLGRPILVRGVVTDCGPLNAGRPTAWPKARWPRAWQGSIPCRWCGRVRIRSGPSCVACPWWAVSPRGREPSAGTRPWSIGSGPRCRPGPTAAPARATRRCCWTLPRHRVRPPLVCGALLWRRVQAVPRPAQAPVAALPPLSPHPAEPATQSPGSPRSRHRSHRRAARPARRRLPARGAG